MEDAHVIYRMSRAAERRVFYIDVGNMPTARAEEYVQRIMRDFRNKLVYDSATGEVRDDKKFLSMQEDFFLPRREGGKGTEVTTLPAGQNLGQIEDIEYFQKRLYKSLHVPISRMEDMGGGGIGMNRTAEISRDEVKFGRFITKLRKRFEHLFKELIRVQLLLKGVILLPDWDLIRQDLHFDYQKDSVFQEMKDQEMWTSRFTLLQQVDPDTPIVGTYISRDWVKANILKFNDEQIEVMQKQIDKEAPQIEKERQDRAELETGAFFDTGDKGE
jgi:hypothetical protein